jgi:hypothetical protein
MSKNNDSFSETAVDPLRHRPLLRALRNWRLRHQVSFNLWIHVIGIPLALGGVVMFFFYPWFVSLAMLVGGYALQYWGHRVEGNDVGEWAAIKRLFGRPYISIAPQFQASSKSSSSRPDRKLT